MKKKKEKKVQYLCEDRIEAFLSYDHPLLTLDKPCGANQWSLGLFLYPIFALQKDSYMFCYELA